MVNQKLQSMFEDYKITNKPTLVVEVDNQPGALMDEMAKSYLSELYRVAGSAGPFLLGEVEQEMIRKYLSTLSWMRACHVVSDKSKVFDAYRSLYRRLAVPVLAYQFLIGIGEALDRDYSIKFVPVATIREKDLLSPDEMRELSDLFFSLQNSGFKVVAGLPQEIEGELDFMAMCHVEGLVLSYRKSHPVYGFLASFFAQQQLNEVTGSMCRIFYGYASDYAANISHLIASIGGGG